MISAPTRSRLAALATTTRAIFTATAVAAGGLLAVGPSTPAHAAVQYMGELTIVSETNQPLLEGGSATKFSLAFPSPGFCSGDGIANYRVMSFMMPATDDVGATLFTASEGPTPSVTGSGGGVYRQPLFDADLATPYLNELPGVGDGIIGELDDFSFNAWDTAADDEIPEGLYTVGIACVQFDPTSSDPVPIDRYWTAEMAITHDSMDQPGGLHWEAVLPATAPGAPTGATAVAGAGQASVSWTAPASDGGSAITGYTVTSNPGALTCTTTGATSCVVSGLTNGTPYTFRVTATNAVGTSAASTPSTAVTPLAVPGAPTGVTAVAGDAQATVSWTAPSANGGSAITGYAVTSNPGGLTCTTTGAPSCVVSGLTNGTPYIFSVTATNAVGSSPSSTPSATVTPKAPTAPLAPTAVTGVPGNGQVTVSWTAPDNGGSAITGYAVTSNPGGLTCTTTAATSCVVSGLTNGTGYTFTVTATNAIGTSPASGSSATVTPATVPGAPTGATAIAGNGQATVSWTVPASNGGSVITGYTVTAAPGGATCTTSAPTSCVVPGLANGTSYAFTVRASNAVGNSAASAPTATVMPVGAPGAPTAVTATTGNGQVTVSWTAPASNGGVAITGYTVASAPGGLTCTSMGTSCVVSGLANGTAYTFTVSATNPLGTSPASAASASVTPAEPPSAPTGVIATAGDNQVTVSWAAPASNGGSAIIGYTVTASPGGATCSTTGATSCVVMGLSSDVAYTFTVTATNAAGASPVSAESPAVTPSTPDQPSVVPVQPGRYWDTRSGPTIDAQLSGTGRLAAGSSFEIEIAGRQGVPASATGIVANLTVIAPDGPGFATLYPCSDDVPTVSTVNYTANSVVANNAIAPLSEDGTVCVFTLSGADFALDVNGFVDPDSPQVGIDPARYLDTRGGESTFDGGSLGAGQTPAGGVTAIPIAGRGDVPADAQAVMVNVTAVSPTAPGYLTLYPCGTTPPTASTVNYMPGQVVPNGAVVELADDGTLCVFTLAAVDILLDVTGFVPADVDSIVPMTPARLHDSRAGEPLVDGSATGPRLAAGAVVEVQVTGRAGVPDTASAAFFNVAAVFPDGPGFVTLFPCSDSVPTTSNVNHSAAGVVVANNATTLLSDTGSVCVYTLTATDVILDITGYLQ